ncbi:MAG: peptidoglycan glycosyltransferase, partial [Defluviitaleaceae bacterium]|nr:peptidoglycan glycosyltransferase [Defluviitaleaceae bacterium]
MNTARDIKKKLIMVMTAIIFALGFLFVRVAYVQTVRGAELQARAYAQQTRDRLISPDRGNIYDRNMVGLAMTESVASVSVIRAQIEDPRLVAETLSRMLSMDFDYVYTKVNRRVALERIKTQVDKALA